MNGDAPLWVEVVASALLATSGVLVLLSAMGFVSLRDFFLRMHPPALAYTLGSWTVTVAAVLTLSTRATSARLHPWLVIALLVVTVPVTTVILARAAVFRSRQEGDATAPPPLAPKAGDAPGVDLPR